MKGRWFYYWKKAQGRICSERYRFIKEEDSYVYEDESAHLSECEEWARRVDDCGNYSERGFEFGFDDIDSPPQEWIDKKIISTKKEIEEKQEYIKILESFKISVTPP